MYSETSIAAGVTLWRSRASEASTIPADGCVDVILHDDAAWVAGPSTRWLLTRPDTELTTVGVRFDPGTATAALRIEPAEIRDRLVALEDVVGRSSALRTREAMLRQRGSAAFVVASAMPLHAPVPWVLEVRDGARRGLTAGDAAALLAVSEREFRRRMQACFGYGYSTLVRIERARRARALIATGLALGDAAAAAGYADQPHLSREFRRLVGLTPAQFAARAA